MSSSVAGLPVNDKVKTLEHDYMKAKDEILTLLRERGDVRCRFHPFMCIGSFQLSAFR